MELFTRHIQLHYTQDPQQKPTIPHNFSTGPFHREIDPEQFDASSSSPIYTFGIYSRRIRPLIQTYKTLSICLRLRPPADWKSAPKQTIERWREKRLSWAEHIELLELQLEVASRGVVLPFFAAPTPQELAEERTRFAARVPSLEDSSGWSVRHEGLFILRLLGEVESYKDAWAPLLQHAEHLLEPGESSSIRSAPHATYTSEPPSTPPELPPFASAPSLSPSDCSPSSVGSLSAASFFDSSSISPDTSLDSNYLPDFLSASESARGRGPTDVDEGCKSSTPSQRGFASSFTTARAESSGEGRLVRRKN
ncbi:hypothetical protein BCR35DRAFT_298504 [Leucosporidium creatinivorum]|uniref:Uncharacterized protein n=1 Tax=Leucosporidium creatinivorum TaxID=106004 RepID=A0A1Y2G4N6_9BASI|nr:hypothetical protein BCR35DRAFT_298504 [Leucosporidium creatinivorum]